MFALKIWWRACRHLQHRGYIYIWANLCFVITALPIVTAPAGFAGLVKLSRALQRGERADLNTFWSGVRENLGRGSVLGALTLLILIINGSNLIAYAPVSVMDLSLHIVWIAAIALWLALMFYFWPVYYAMEKPTTIGVLRNALLVILRHPASTLIHGIGLIALGILSLILPFLALLLTCSFAAILSTGAVLSCLAKAGPSPSAAPVCSQGHADLQQAL
ncbi:MAG: DUF624 domain-containing protein [Chloroflexota bacterium]|nr:DUF624 domain-containing protein [Chloroflexota bacterium]